MTERPRRVAVRAARLFDGVSARLVPDPLVLIDGGVIVAAGPRLAAPAGADVVDLGDATVLPGLVDTHVHLAFDASQDPVGRLAGRDDEQARQAMTAAARAALRGGVTTVRDLGDRGYLALGLRGTAGLPTILAAGPPLTTPGGHCHYLGGAVEPTAAAAGVLGLGSRKGRVAPGFDADLLVADGDPVADPDALHRVRAVYAGGRPHPLDARLPGAAAAGTPPARCRIRYL